MLQPDTPCHMKEIAPWVSQDLTSFECKCDLHLIEPWHVVFLDTLLQFKWLLRLFIQWSNRKYNRHHNANPTHSVLNLGLRPKMFSPPTCWIFSVLRRDALTRRSSLCCEYSDRIMMQSKMWSTLARICNISGMFTVKCHSCQRKFSKAVWVKLFVNIQFWASVNCNQIRL